MTIPYPDNPQHVDNLRSIKLLEAQGFTGTDASLVESLFEYGLAWRAIDNINDLDLNAEWLIVYRHPSIPTCFDRLTLRQDTDPRYEWNWVKWAEVASFAGLTEAEFLAQSLLDIIFTLVLYYGTEEIFGTSYWEGFEIAE